MAKIVVDSSSNSDAGRRGPRIEPLHPTWRSSCPDRELAVKWKNATNTYAWVEKRDIFAKESLASRKNRDEWRLPDSLCLDDFDIKKHGTAARQA